MCDLGAPFFFKAVCNYACRSEEGTKPDCHCNKMWLTRVIIQVIFSSSRLDASPQSPPPPIQWKTAFLTFCKGWKTKDLCLLIRLNPVPYLNENWNLFGCSLEERKWCARQEFQLQLLMTGRGHHCSILSCPTKKWPSYPFSAFSAVWHQSISTSFLNMLCTNGKKGITFGVIFTVARQEPGMEGYQN